MSLDSDITTSLPRVPVPDPGAHRRGPRRWWKRLVIGLLLLANLAVFGVYWTLRTAQEAFRDNATQLADVVPELNERPSAAAEPLVFLVIGSDSRAGLDSLQNFGESEGARGDVIMLVKLHPSDGSAQILSMPRDLLVEIPGHGTNRVNAAYSFGGAALMVRTIKQLTGLPIHHYVEIDFVGFQAVVDEIGGIYIDFPYPARDTKSGLAVEAGHQRLDGSQALAYARSRQYEELRDGRWVAVDASDFGRTRRQQQVVLGILSAIKEPGNLTETGAIVGGFSRHLSVDAALAGSSIVELAFRMRGISAEKIETATLPGYIDTFEGMSIVRMDHPGGDNIIAAFAAGEPMTVQGDGPLRIQVLNGNGTKGSAGRWSDVLEARGFDILAVGDADRSDFAVTTVIVRPDGMLQGQMVIEALGFGTVATGTVDDSVDAVVIVGLDADRTAQSG